MFVIRSHGSKSQFIQLGYISPGSRGALQYKNKIEDDKFEIEVTVSVNDNNTIKSGQGLIIFISNSDQHEEGDFYGKGGSIDGLCICLDTSDYKNPFISAYSGLINTNDTKKVFKDKKYVDLEDNNKIKFRIVQDHRTLEVFVQDGHNELLVYSTRKNLVSKGSTLGMSASNSGSGQYSYMINSVEVGSACDWITGDDLREKNIEIVLKVLLNKSKTKKMFYHEIDEEQSKKIAKGIYNEIQIDYDKMDVYLLAAALKVYCLLYLDYYLPKDIHFSLLKVFKANKRTTQKEIIKRLPFIMDNTIRMFFIGLFDLFRGISENTNESETTLDNLLDLFGPLVIKNPENYIDFNAFTKREVLKDLMKADFEHVSIDFLQD
ncbi:VIP36-like vesicular integral membrane protein, partial [Nosema bombycis CQ1]